MKPVRDVFGRYNGAEVLRHTLRHRDGGIEVAVIDYGARIQSILVPDAHGTMRETTLGFDSLDGYLGDHDYLGATIGRCANRIASGRFNRGGRRHRLTVNNGPHHLHGGTVGFDQLLWHLERRESPPGGDSITFTLESPDGDQGYPGTLNAEVTCTIVDGETLMIEYRARTSEPTPVNLTNHAYWNLHDSHDTAILDHELTLSCPGFLPVDDTLIPLGTVVAVDDTPMDFRSPRGIGDRMDRVHGGYDHCYVARDGCEAIEEPVHIATVRNPRNGRVLSMATTKPAVQFYTGNFLRDLPGRTGIVYQQYAGLCLEPQYPPNAVNAAYCPEIILEPGREYRHRTVYTFSIQ